MRVNDIREMRGGMYFIQEESRVSDEQHKAMKLLLAVSCVWRKSYFSSSEVVRVLGVG